eukprot:EC839961.1.p2 GENE.EC839961.1~~EC839961.1.p2  ORF type:complete len:146 (-),score=3.32 EC839961.1:295-732(-)
MGFFMVKPINGGVGIAVVSVEHIGDRKGGVRGRVHVRAVVSLQRQRRKQLRGGTQAAIGLLKSQQCPDEVQREGTLRSGFVGRSPDADALWGHEKLLHRGRAGGWSRTSVVRMCIGDDRLHGNGGRDECRCKNATHVDIGETRTM